MKYKVWECKIVVPGDTELPNGFDAPPRSAAIAAVEGSGISVLSCYSGWGGTLTKEEEQAMNDSCGDVYIAGLLDTEGGVSH